MQSNNTVVVAAAGSRKTTLLVEWALARSDKRILITTYTNEGINQIVSFIVAAVGYVPKHITVLTWYTFLLQDGVRPYRSYLTDRGRVESINFKSQRNTFAKRSNANAFYLDRGNNVYSEGVSDFVYECNKRSNGRVFNRIAAIYDCIFIDEAQDLAGYDLELVDCMFDSSIETIIMADPRQVTFTTNKGQKNRQYKRSNVIEWFQKNRDDGKCVIDERNECYRSNQIICDFSDRLYPNYPETISRNGTKTKHDGIFEVKPEEVHEYINTYHPKILRYNKKSETMGYPALNIGLSKGQTFDRVLIFPTSPMKKYLQTKNISNAGDVAKLYVAVTRARYSAAFVVS